ncbi:phosphotransferase [Roseovarius indicus]|uniref:Choline kinase n=1 Tax=Roseovarius indicus TaxID=540747 RepID=A0A0T5P2Z9_9RHOB|nr:phosphotransferase [Roseovarius indicus]KRS15512.1 choline kinase [Roseovarius indicus]QEW25298.1 thiamine kinase [Roseovarius indicus]SFE20339.1 Thiamine kinase [Roseovarius indicus]
MTTADQAALDRATSLSIWTAPEDAVLLGGGITNFNVALSDGGRRYVVRVGQDILLHQIMRFNEQTVHRAAEAIGIAPAIRHTEPGILVLEYIEATTLDEAGVRDDAMLERILPVLKKCHREAPLHLRGPVLTFWVFHVLRDYAATLRADQSRHVPKLDDLLKTAETLERAVGQVDIVLGHNDLLAANFLDAGDKLWLLDWEYGGFNSPLFDLAGLASNNELAPAQENWLLENYFETPLTDELNHRYHAMKCASLLRETMWSMVSEIHSDIDFDYADYTDKNLTRFESALSDFQSM